MPLWIVATPIGTLGDCSERARTVLAEATLVAAEDTRVTRRLLAALDIRAPRMVSVRAKNERDQLDMLVEEARNGDLVYVCDAGTPAISDPGTRLVEAILDAGVRILSVPGPSALPTALSVSGFLASPSYFAGFAPKKGRENWLHRLLERTETLVVFEAPTRIRDLVKRCARVAPRREAAVCRELSKKHEEVIRASFDELVQKLADHPTLKGEIVLVVGPSTQRDKQPVMVSEDSSHSSIAKALAARWGISKQDAYRELSVLDDKFAEED